jgi:rod shape-determining protein MreC
MAAVGLLLAAPFLLPASWRERVGGALRDAFAPVQEALAGLRAALPPAWRGASGEPTREALAEEAGRLRHEVRRLQALERENRVLRAQLGFQAAAPQRLIAAEVIARDLNTWWHTVRIGKGAVDGIRPDMPVLSPEGLIGKTVAVSGYTSDVRLLVDPDSSVSACLQRLEAFGMVRGGGVSRRGDALCRMTFLVKDLAIQPGEEVVTSGLSAIYPRGLLVGYVSRVYPDRSGLYQNADVIPAADLNALRIVYVVDRSPVPGVGTVERR